MFRIYIELWFLPKNVGKQFFLTGLILRLKNSNRSRMFTLHLISRSPVTSSRSINFQITFQRLLLSKEYGGYNNDNRIIEIE